MATSTIQRTVSTPEFTTQTVAATVSLVRAGGSIAASLTSGTNVSSVSATGTSTTVSSVTLNVAKSGYTLVGITYTPSGSYSASSNSRSYAYFTVSDHNPNCYFASVTVSGNTLVVTPSSSITIPTSGHEGMQLGSITCKYVKNN